MAHDFRDTPDQDHPIRWHGFGDQDTRDRWLSIADAIDRLTRDDPSRRFRHDIATRLMRGETLRTMFAAYSLDLTAPGAPNV